MSLTANNIRFSDKAMAYAQEIISHYPAEERKSALLPLLHVAQGEFDNWLAPEVMDYVAKILHVSPIEVYEVATFYSMYNMVPVGKTVFEICQTGPCMAVGADKIIDYTCGQLGIKRGGTSKDGMFTVKCVECLGACGYAPMMQVNGYFHEFLTEGKMDELMAQYRINPAKAGRGLVE